MERPPVLQPMFSPVRIRVRFLTGSVFGPEVHPVFLKPGTPVDCVVGVLVRINVEGWQAVIPGLRVDDSSRGFGFRW